jgi:hypothetical protein
MSGTTKDRRTIERAAKERRRQEAIEELKKNGIDVKFEALTNGEQQMLLAELAPEYDPPESMRINAQDEFESSPTAKPLTANDIANIEALSTTDCREVLKRLASLLGYREIEALVKDMRGGFYQAWPDDDRRWTLTPHQLRRETEKRLRAQTMNVVS